MIDGTRLWIPTRVREAMEAEADAKFPLETGGVLMGYETTDGNAVVTAVIGPGPGAKHSPWRFDPDGDWQWKEVETVYAQSGRYHTYLGDWHTHPNGVALMSGLDANTLCQIAGAPQARAPNAAMVILAGVSGSWRPAAWRWRDGKPVLQTVLAIT